MKSPLPMKRILIYGFLLWLFPLIVSFFVFPIKTYFAPFFETIMAVTLAICGVVIAIAYFGRLSNDFLRQGAIVGLVWFAMCVLIDLPLFLLGGPMQMPFPNYMMDIGFTYLMYPIITMGFGYLLEKNRTR